MLEVQTNPGDIRSSALPQAAVKGDRSEPALNVLSGGQTTQHVDVLIVGAGLSGIGAAYYLQAHGPTKSFAILEARQTLGGTWDLFRYPGIRSDSDMYTLGFSFRPWRSDKSIAMVHPSCVTSKPPPKSTGSTAQSGSTTASHAPRGPPPM